jgi:ferrous iron transport protein A
MNPHNETNPGTASCQILTEAPLNTPLKVTSIAAGRQAQARLACMGILPGEVIKVVQRDNGGPLLVEVKGTRVALGRGISHMVTVHNGNGVHPE